MQAQWPKVARIYNRALELDPALRMAFLSEVCRGDDHLREEVESLLANTSAGATTSATIQPGKVLGPYRILKKLGEGGMGIVYEAIDTRLGRTVALKAIKKELLEDRDAARRFELEARAVASLTHPNVASIYGFEEQNGTRLLVLEYVPGGTLADRLRRGPVPVHELLPIAKQIAAGIEAAHERGIIHRDLKPANIKVTQAGQVKILDFGLAKMLRKPAGDPEQTETANASVTKSMAVVGTPAYMSPEQARGDATDARTDVWAFGCLLYEALTGKKAFAAPTLHETLARIAEQEPDWRALPGETPQAIYLLVHRCLRKDPHMRLRDIGDARIQIEEALAGPHRGPPFHSGDLSRPALKRNAYAPIVGTLAVVATIVFAILSFVDRDGIGRDSVAFALSAPEGNILLPAAVPSPDGRLIAFVARDPSGPSALWIRSLASKTVQRLPDTEGAVEPFWSPDSGSIAFFAHGKLKRVAVSGGPAQNICNAVSGIGGTWNRSGDIVFAAGNRTPLYRVSAVGGKTEPVTTLDADRQENSHRWPYFLPDGRHFFFTARSNGPENTAVYVGSLDSKTTKRLLTVQSNAIYTDPGFLLFGRDGTLMAQPFDRKKLELSGEPLPIGRVQHNSPSAKAMIGVSSNGSVITFYDATQNYAELHWYDRSGAELKLARPRGMFSNPRFSPDGKHVALSVTDPESGYRDIWTLDPVTGGMTRVTFHPANDWYAVWLRDGRELIFASDRLGHSSIFRKRIDGAGEERLILPPAENGLFPNDVSPDATAFLYQQLDSTGRIDLWLYRLDGQTSTRRWRVSQSRDRDASFSPDSSHIAYSSDESGTSEIYVSSIEKPEKHRVSVSGGQHVAWRGNEIFFLAPNDMLMSVAITTRKHLQVGTPKALFRLCAESQAPPLADSIFDANADGSQFAVVCFAPETKQRSITVLLNWRAGK